MTVEIQIPSVLKLGAGSFAEVPAGLTRLGGKCPLIVTDAFLMSRGLPQKLIPSGRFGPSPFSM